MHQLKNLYSLLATCGQYKSLMDPWQKLSWQGSDKMSRNQTLKSGY